MKIFDTAYLRLTGWYVLIIMTISLLFSGWVYNQARNEVRVGLSNGIPVESIGHGGSLQVLPLDSDLDEYNGLVNDRLSITNHRLLVRLTILNIGVLAVGAAASYWLARRTLHPIKESVDAQNRFTADASHELRTPLAAMKTEIEVGLRDANITKQEAVALLESNLEEIDRLGTLVEGLLALSQTPVAAELLPVSLEDVAAKVARRLQPLAAAKQLTVTRRLEPVIVQGDGEAIDKIIGILLDNAIKYSPAKAALTIQTYQKDGHAYLQVIDTGVGIKASELPHIFDRFYRADASRSKTRIPGHGIGLSIAHKLAEDMDATLSATSTPDKGSTFTLRFTV